MTEGCLCTFHESSANGTNAKGRFVGVHNMVVNDGCDVNIDVIFGHANLRWDFDDGDFDIDLLQFLAQSEN